MAENSSEGVTSTQKALQSSHDPGWNDPPKWALSSTGNASGTSSKRLLNKRVAFPLSSASSPSNSIVCGQQLPPSNLPPPPMQLANLTTAPHAPLLAPSGMEKCAGNNSQIFNKTETLNQTLENLRTVIKDELDSDNIEDVKKRLELMKTMWNGDKLDDKIQRQVLKISEALINKDTDAADKLHVSLMMDHAALCNTWIPGIRHLILGLREKNSQTNSDNRSSAQPIFLLNPTKSKNT